MKSAVFYGVNDIKIENNDIPNVKKNEVLINVKACGICGTDVHIFNGHKGAATVTPPTILGHEFAGEIVKIGKNVNNLRVGDRVCVDPNELCGNCFYCLNGLGNFCEHIKGVGTTINGGFAEYVSISNKQVYRLADTTTYEEGAMTEPVACCLHGIDMCNISVGDKICIIGAGMIGLIMLQLAKLKGVSKAIVIEPVEAKRKMAMKLGADIVVDPIKQDIKEILAENNIIRLSCVIECAGLTSTIKQAIEIAGKKSIVMMFGLTKPDDELLINPFKIFQNEIEIKASFINPYTQTRALELINNKKIDVSSMVCEVAPLEKLSEILSSNELRAKGKYIINPKGQSI